MHSLMEKSKVSIYIYGLRMPYFFLRFYLFMRDTGREAEIQAEEEAGSMREPDVGLDPRTPGSCPGPKAGAKPLSHQGCP